MKTKIFLSCFCAILFIFSCQKEEVITNSVPVPKVSTTDPLSEIRNLIPDNVEILPNQRIVGLGQESAIFLPDRWIDLTDCDQQPCYLVVPNYLNQTQRTADLFCQPVNVNICCCAKDNEWCFRFKVNPRFTCNNVPKDIQLLPENGITPQSN